MINQDGSAPIKNTSREGSYRAQGETGMRPANDPKSHKDFKKILGKDSNDEDAPDESAEDGVTVGQKSEPATPSNVSLFGLSSAKAKESQYTDAPPQHLGFTNKSETAHVPSATPESPSSLFSRMTKQPGDVPQKMPVDTPQDLHAVSTPVGETAKAPGKEIIGSLIDTPRSAETPPPVENKAPLFPFGDKENAKDSQGEKKPLPEGFSGQAVNQPGQVRPSTQGKQPVVGEEVTSLDTGKVSGEEPKKEKFTTRFSTEQTDLSYVNLMAVNAQPIAAAEVKADKAIMPVTDIQEIVNQLVDKLYTISQSGKTDTAIILKHPPILEGAQLIVTSFDNAKGQFNISFENLSQAGKNLLDMRLNQESLMNALEQKGYAVHILTTTTLVENRPILTDNAQNQQGQGQNEERDQPRDGRQQRRNREEERET